MQVLKLLTQETNLASSSSVDNATLVRVFNNQNAQASLLVKDSTDANILGSITMAAYEVAYIQKSGDQLLAGGSNVKVTKIAFTN